MQRFVAKSLPCSWGLIPLGPMPTTALLVIGKEELASEAEDRLLCAPAIPAGICSEDGGLPYRIDAMVPADAFRPVRLDLLPAARRAPECPGEFVGLVRLQERALCKLRDLAHRVANGEEAASISSVRIIRNAIRLCFRMEGPVEVNGVAKTSPGLRTVTADRRRSLRIGLHLDSWERTLFHERRFARNRISVNLGDEPRRFLFMTTPIEIVFRELGLSREANRYPVDQAFQAVSQDRLQVYSLTIRPGEAYIAPTECLVHDASTQSMRAADLSLTIRVATMPSESMLSVGVCS